MTSRYGRSCVSSTATSRAASGAIRSTSSVLSSRSRSGSPARPSACGRRRTTPSACLAVDLLGGRTFRTRGLPALAEHLPYALGAAGWLLLRHLAFGSAVRAERIGGGFVSTLLGTPRGSLLALLGPASAGAA